MGDGMNTGAGKGATNDNCVFCKIIGGQIPAKIHFQNEKLVVLHDIHPQAPTHLLFVPKAHVDSLDQIQDYGTLVELFQAIQELTRQMGLAKIGYRTIINTGRGGGQSVFHLHIHVLSGRPMSETFG